MNSDPEGSSPPARPTPVRMLMQSEAGVREAEAALEGRSFEAEGESWIVRGAGVTRSGSGRDAGAPLLLLHFLRAGGSGTPERSILTVGRGLEEIEEEDLPELFARSRSIPSP